MFNVEFKSKGEWYFAKQFDSYDEAVGFGVEAIYFNPSVENARVVKARNGRVVEVKKEGK